jgi:HPt (histidine-containing phosphotransfer) domain-containing protein
MATAAERMFGRGVLVTEAERRYLELFSEARLPTAASDAGKLISSVPLRQAADVRLKVKDATALEPVKSARPLTDSLRELVTLYLDQTATQVEQIAAAVQAGAPGEVRRVAHSCAGASATCGMRRMVPLLRELERQGYEEKLTNAAELSRQVGGEFQRIRSFLEAHLASLSKLAAKG